MSVEDRRELLLNALGRAYDEGGPKSLTMDAVARSAGMSKRTVYSVFSDRGALFIAYFQRVRKDFIRELCESACDLPLEARLRLMLEPQPHGYPALPIDIFRSLIAEAPERPEMAQEFLRQVRGHSVQIIAAELERAQERGEIAACDSTLAAAILLDMIKPNILDFLLGGENAPSLEARHERFRLGLTIAIAGLAK